MPFQKLYRRLSDSLILRYFLSGTMNALETSQYLKAGHMPGMIDLDPTTSFMSQLREETGPIVLVNTFFVPREKTEEFLACWREDAAFMKSCPGFISAQLHRGTAGSQLAVNIATWESTEALARAHSNPEFRARSSKHPDGVVVYPHVYQKIAVEGICGA